VNLAGNATNHRVPLPCGEPSGSSFRTKGKRMKKMLMLLLVVAAAAGLMVATTPAAQAGDGCVTIGEARRALDDEVGQNRNAIEREFGATPIATLRERGVLWAEYQPCLRPDSDRTYMHVIYYRTAMGNWKSIFWVWQLFSPYYARTVGDSYGIATH
jgi:hypothetical protein